MNPSSPRTVIGLISDTHGMLRPSVYGALEGVELILHAGDVGGSGILYELGTLAPVLAVYGNTDPPGEPWLEENVVIESGGLSIRVTHGHELGSPTPAKLLEAYGERVIVYGHTHRQLITREGARLVINPGSAGAPRFKLGPSVARLTIENGVAEAEIVPLD